MPDQSLWMTSTVPAVPVPRARSPAAPDSVKGHHARTQSQGASPEALRRAQSPLSSPFYNSAGLSGFHRPSSPLIHDMQFAIGPIPHDHFPTPSTSSSFNRTSHDPTLRYQALLPSANSRSGDHPRSRASSGSNAHIRCSPHCEASRPPYRMLDSAIGRASNMNLRNTQRGNLRNDWPYPSPMPARRDSTHHDLQYRRRRFSASQPMDIDGAEPLHIDRRQFELPPAPVIDADARRYDTSVDFFSAVPEGERSGSATSPAILTDMQVDSPDPPELALPRSSSAPALKDLPSNARRGSNDSMTTETTTALSRQPTASTPTTPAVPYTDTMRRPDLTDKADRMESVRRLFNNPQELSSYIGPHMTAMVQSRLPAGGVQKVGALSSSGKDELPLEKLEKLWSFDAPLAEVMKLAVESMLRNIQVSGQMVQIAEYNCHREAPFSTLSTIVEAVKNAAASSGHQANIVVTHTCPVTFDARALQRRLETETESYRRGQAAPHVLTSFTFSPFGQVVFAPGTVDIGLSSGELSKLHSVPIGLAYHSTAARKAGYRETIAHDDLTKWLNARAREIKSGGYLACYFYVRRTLPAEDGATYRSGRTTSAQQLRPAFGMTPAPRPPHAMSAPPTPPPGIVPGGPDAGPFTGPPLQSPPSVNGQPQKVRYDLWQAMHQAVGIALQPAVGLGEIGVQVAPRILDVPLWPRTLAESTRTLSMLTEWDIVRDEVEDLDDGIPLSERIEWMRAGVRIHKLYHPAWTALCKGEIDRSTYSRRVAAFVRNIYENHMKHVLRTHGDRDVSQAEISVSETFRVLVNKCDAGMLDALELDVGVICLRRK